MKLNLIKRRGQVMVLYALLIPLMFLFVGVGLDLGWYYLNVSRLQNAADAAVLAGAKILVEQAPMNSKYTNYYVKTILPLTIPPKDIKEYTQVRLNGELESTEAAEELADKEVLKYSGQNLGYVENIDTPKTAILYDDWNTSSNTELHKVNWSTTLYTKTIDAQWREDSDRYYSVTLHEKVTHLLFRGFEPMDAVVSAYVLLQPHDVDLITVIKKLEDTKVIANWQYQDKYKDFDGKWNHYRQTVGGKKAVSYVADEYFRTETVNVEIAKGDNNNNGFSDKNTSGNKSSGQSTSANGGKYYDEMQVDSLNIDFNQDIATQFSEDWDLGASLPAGKKLNYKAEAMDGWDANNGADLRIQGRINIRNAWRNRNLMDDKISNDLIPDVLWVRIESDPWWSTKAVLPWLTSNTSSEGWDSVHQMIISIDADNTDSTENAFKFTNNKKKVNNNFVDGDFDGYEIEGGKAYKYRPLFIFYKGPETYDENNTVRQSQPVILNLNKNFNGILYAPNSPVVILGNNNTMRGFVIAKEFVRLKEVSDYTNIGYTEYTDLNDKPILIKNGEVFSEDELDIEYPDENYYKETDADGVISVYDISDTPKYLIIDSHYVKGVAGYTDNDYVEALKKYREVTDSDIVAIKFPDLDAFGAKNNEQTYHVVKTDLLDESALPAEELNKQSNKNTYPSAKYVPVTVVSTNEKKYIAKTNLPYVRMYIQKDGDHYPYVPVCDLKITAGFPSNIYKVNGATLADDDHNAYTNSNLTDNQHKIDDEKDMWKVVAVTDKWWNNNDSNANPAKITKVVDKNGYKYFVAKRELVGSYSKKIQDNSNVKYVRSDNDAYFTYYDYQTFQDNPDEGRVIRLVMDSNGNVQTKPLDAGDYFHITDDYAFQPGDDGWNKKIIDKETNERTKEYRVPDYEVVYKKSAFDLNDDSCYSYFQIPTLHRVNYTYMNVDELNHTSEDPGDNWKVEDMFFTTRRANWID